MVSWGAVKSSRAAGIEHHLDEPPEHMVDELDVAKLHREVRAMVGALGAAEVSREAGRLTGDYLLANRIRMPRSVFCAFCRAHGRRGYW